MKILHIETGRHLYGGALQVYYLMRGLHEQGIENILVCDRTSEIGARAAGIARVVGLPLHGDIDPRLFTGLVRTLQSERPAILHSHSRRGADWWGGLAARYCNTPAILTRRVDNPEHRLAAALKYNRYDRVVTISEGIRQVLLAEGIAPDRLQLIHSVVDLERYQKAEKTCRLQELYGLDTNAVTIGVIAQLIERKGHRYLFAVLPEIVARHPETKVIIFGQGPLRNELEEECRRLGVDGSVIFAGFRDDLDQLLPELDLVVHPALMEGLGVSLLQASACGLPIVGARAGGIPEIVRDGCNGRLVPPGESGPLRDAVLEMLDNPDLRRQFGAAGRSLVEEEFSIPAMVDAYRKLYDRLAR